VREVALWSSITKRVFGKKQRKREFWVAEEEEYPKMFYKLGYDTLLKVKP
jgi:hypothetical protein